nr:serine hydrolase-like protein [Onthophagus taurus]
MNTKEIKIPVPWGHIAAKTWGKEENQTVICVHGTLDNAGSFDTLIPHLPQSFYYVCIDLPGHGLSSHYEKYLPVTFHNLLLPLRIVCEYLARDTYIFMGHSLGARLLVTHCQLFQQQTSKLILIDSTYTLPKPPVIYLMSLEDTYNNLMKSLDFKPEDRPSMTYAEAVRKVKESRFSGTLTYETAEHITRRMVEKNGDKYQFTYDPRLKTILEPPVDMKYIEELLKLCPLQCPVIVLAMKDTVEAFEKYEFSHNYMNVIPDSEVHVIDGHHHYHHTNPESVAIFISKFLLDQSKL